MKAKFLVALTCLAVLAGLHSTLGAAQAPTKSVQHGVYTADQAKRGQPLYDDNCSPCHTSMLVGGEMAPPLTGGQFYSNWTDLTVGDIFERMRTSMPANAPGSLKGQQYADILAYVLSVAKFPAGAAEIAPDMEALKQIKFQAPKQ